MRINITLSVLLVVCTALCSQVRAQTRLGLHYTQEELVIWKQRIVNGPYRTKNDFQPNSPGDWDRIKANASAFLTNPAADSYTTLVYTGNDCVPTDFTGKYDPTTTGEKLRDAAFYYLLTGDNNYAAAVRSVLLAEASNPLLDFTNTGRWCPGGLGDLNPGFFIAEWLRRLLYSYDYIKGSLSDADKAQLNTWFLGAATYMRSNYDPSLDALFVNRATGNYAIAQSWMLQKEGDTSNGALMYYGGPKARLISRQYNNRRASMASFVGLTGLFLEDASLSLSGKGYFKELVMFGIYPSGYFVDFLRGVDASNPETGYSYATLHSLFSFADALARSGDTELYDWTTKAGTTAATSGVDASSDGLTAKGLKMHIKAMLDLRNHVTAAYATSNAANVGDDFYLIDGVNSTVGNYSVWDVMYAVPNLYYADNYLRSSYLRTAAGAIPYPAKAQNSGALPVWTMGGYPGMLLMFGQMDGKVWPFPPKTAVNQAPTISITSPTNNAQYIAGSDVTINVNASDSDGSVVKVEFFDAADTLWKDLVSPYSFTWSNVAAGSYSLLVKATDNDGATALSNTVNFTVINRTGPVVSNAIPNQLTMVGVAYSFSFAASTFRSPEGYALSYSASLSDDSSLPDWLNFDSSNRTFSGTAPNGSASPLTIKVTASDGQLQTNTLFLLTIQPLPNQAPVVSNVIPDQTATVGTAYSFGFTANTFRDPEGGALTYSASLSDDPVLPGWLTFNATTRTFSGTPPSGSESTLSIKVTASDSQQEETSTTFSLTIQPPPNQSPVVSNAIPAQTATVGVAYSFSVPASTFGDPDGDALTYLASMSDDSALPAWLSFNASSRTFSGAPASASSLIIKVTASDGSLSVSTAFSLTIQPPPNQAPVVVNAIPNQTATVGTGYIFIFAANTFSDPEGSILTYSASLSDNSVLPAWLSFNTTSRTFSGTPPSASSLTVKVTASDGSLQTSATFSFTISAAPNQAPVVVNTIPNQTTTVGVAYIFSFAANTFSDPDGNALTYSASLSSNATLPAWLSFNATTRTFSGTPPSGIASTLSIKVTASDGSLSATTSLSLTIQPPPNQAPVVVNAIPNQSATVGIAYSFTFATNTFSDPEGSALTYLASLSSTAGLPAWLTFNAASRTFSGTPPSGSVSPLSIKVTANDGQLQTSTAFFLTISAAPVGQQLMSFTLINANTDLDLQTLANGASLNLATLPTKNLNIRANTSPTKVGSVVFSLTGKQSRNYTDSGPIYALFGDSNGNYKVWVPAVGSYTLKATPYSAASSAGTKGTALTINFTVINQATNQAPIVSNTIPNQNATVGAAFSFAFAANTFSDPEGSALTYSASLSSNAALPAWLSFNAASRTFSGTPPSGSVSPLSIKVAASDGQLQTSTTFSLTVNTALNNRAPVVSNVIPNQTATVGIAYSFSFASNTFSDPESSALSYSASLSDNSVIPAWLSFNAASRTFSGKPTSAATLTVKVTASDGSLSTSTNFTLTVNAAPAGQQLVSFTLINADTDLDIQTLSSGASLNLAALPTRNLNIRANTSPVKVGSVVFNLTGQQTRNQTESGAPYALFGDNNGDYAAWVPATGSYALKGTPYSAAGGTGTLGTALTINFTVINQAGARLIGNEALAINTQLLAYPNPVTDGRFKVSLSELYQGEVSYVLVYATGVKLAGGALTVKEPTSELSFDLSDQMRPVGVYYLRLEGQHLKGFLKLQRQ